MTEKHKAPRLTIQSISGHFCEVYLFLYQQLNYIFVAAFDICRGHAEGSNRMPYLNWL